MTMSPAIKSALNSYARSLVAAALPVWTATQDWKMTLHALWAAAVPPLMRWANPNDPAFGRGSDAA